MISVVILGAGNVGTHIFKAFSKANNISVKQWYNRHLNAMQPFSNTVTITNNLQAIVEADVYIIAVSDDSVVTLAEQLPKTNAIVAHTSGSLGIHALPKHLHRAVFYPLQSFSKDTPVDFKNVPICVEALQRPHIKVLKTLAKAVNSPTYTINTEQRQTLHLAAVFVNNFTNQLYRIAHEISDAKHVEFDILKPLLLETAQKVMNLSPYKAQTGPAKRNDNKTIKRHLKQLENPDHKAIYELLTKAIKITHKYNY